MNRWLNMREACQYARVCRNTMKSLIRSGQIATGYTPGGHYRIDRESIDAHFGHDDQKALAIVKSIRL